MSEGRIARHRNYDELIKRHQRDLRIRRLAVACIYLLIVISLIALFILMKQEKQKQPLQPKSAIHATDNADLKSHPCATEIRPAGRAREADNNQSDTQFHPIENHSI